MARMRRFYGVISMMLALGLGIPGMAAAADFNVVAGPSATSSARTTAAAFASMFGTASDDGHFQFRPIATVGWVNARNTHDDDLDHEVFLAGGGVRITAPDPHWFVSEQVAVTSTRTDALSSRFEFMTSAGWQDGHFIVMLRHVSNGRLIGGGKNLGETMLLTGVKF